MDITFVYSSEWRMNEIGVGADDNMHCVVVFSSISLFHASIFFFAVLLLGPLIPSSVVIAVSYVFMSWTPFSHKPCQISSRKPLINCDNFWCLYDMHVLYMSARARCPTSVVSSLVYKFLPYTLVFSYENITQHLESRATRIVLDMFI